jgi:hypothetical protein
MSFDTRARLVGLPPVLRGVAAFPSFAEREPNRGLARYVPAIPRQCYLGTLLPRRLLNLGSKSKAHTRSSDSSLTTSLAS